MVWFVRRLGRGSLGMRFAARPSGGRRLARRNLERSADLGGQEPRQGIKALQIQIESDAGPPLRNIDDAARQSALEVEAGAGQLDLVSEGCRERRLQPGAAKRQVADPAAPRRAPEHQERLEVTLVARMQTLVLCRRLLVLDRGAIRHGDASGSWSGSG